jgi:hypothetical protein
VTQRRGQCFDGWCSSLQAVLLLKASTIQTARHVSRIGNTKGDGRVSRCMIDNAGSSLQRFKKKVNAIIGKKPKYVRFVHTGYTSFGHRGYKIEFCFRSKENADSLARRGALGTTIAVC